jgi:hypothetical protein
LAYARRLLGYCYLHSSGSRAALREFLRAWEESSRRCDYIGRAICLCALVDASLDLGDWGFVRAYEHAFRVDIGSRADLAATAMVRARAICAQARGQHDEAAGLLESHVEEAQRLNEATSLARYFHHLGMVHIAQAGHGRPSAAHGAARRFREEIGMLRGPGFGYYRGHALLGLATALRILGDCSGASEALDQAVPLVRRIKSMKLLAQCLEARARLSLSDVGLSAEIGPGEHPGANRSGGDTDGR